MALNAKLKKYCGIWMPSRPMALNVKMKIWWLWMANYEWWLWMPNYGEMVALNTWLWIMALNAKLWTTTLNAKLNIQLWTIRWTMAMNVKLKKHGSKRQTEDVALNAKLWGNDEGEYALVWRVATTLDPQIIKPWRSIIIIWMSLAQDTMLEEPIVISKEWSTRESWEK